jgi:hypothetical protein
VKKLNANDGQKHFTRRAVETPKNHRGERENTNKQVGGRVNANPINSDTKWTLMEEEEEMG